jgi:hypothetical protein
MLHDWILKQAKTEDSHIPDAVISPWKSFLGDYEDDEDYEDSD